LAPPKRPVQLRVTSRYIRARLHAASVSCLISLQGLRFPSVLTFNIPRSQYLDHSRLCRYCVAIRVRVKRVGYWELLWESRSCPPASYTLIFSEGGKLGVFFALFHHATSCRCIICVAPTLGHCSRVCPRAYDPESLPPVGQ
jgi:hypothetical protein